VRMILLLGAVLVVGLVGCLNETNPRVAARLNQDAALTGEMPSNPLQGKVITSWVNKQDATMSTLLGNDIAVRYARTNAEMMYPVGEVLSAVTWGEQEDPRWFGGNIPQRPKAVEFVSVTGPGVFSYQRYEGSPLKKVADVEGSDPKDRAAYLLAQRAAVMP
jgi:hypothetical protein